MEEKQEGQGTEHIVTVDTIYIPPDRPLLATRNRLTFWEATKISLKLLVPTSGSSLLVVITAGASVKIISILGKEYYEATSLTTLLEYAMLPFSAMLTPIITLAARVNPTRDADQVPIALVQSLRTSYNDTPLDQAHPTETGKIAHAGIIIGTVCIVPLALLFAFTSEELTGLRQPTELIPIASDFCLPYIGGIPFYLYGCVLTYIANPLGLQMPVFLAQLAGGAVGIGLGALLVLKSDLGVKGMSTGIDIQYFATFAGLLGYYLYKNHRDPKFRQFGLFNLHTPTLREHLKQLWPYIKEISKMGIFISLFAMIELSNFFLTTLFVGWHGAPELAAQLSVQIWMLLAGIINFSLGEVANLLVGQYHAAGRMEDTRLFGKVNLFLGLIWNLFAFTLFEAIPGPLTGIFINGEDPHIKELAESLLRHLAPSTIFDGGRLIGGGPARGLKKVFMTAVTSLLSNLVLNIPLIWYLSIKCGYGLQGMAWARNISLFVGMSIQVVYWFYVADTETGVSSRLTRTIDGILTFLKDKLCCCRRRHTQVSLEEIPLQSQSSHTLFALTHQTNSSQETDKLIKSASINTNPVEEPPQRSWRDKCVIC